MDIEKNKELKKETKKVMNQTIKKVTEDIENFKFNTAISELMKCSKQLIKSIEQQDKDNIEMDDKIKELFGEDEKNNEISVQIAMVMLYFLRDKYQKVEDIEIYDMTINIQKVIASWLILKDEKTT